VIAQEATGCAQFGKWHQFTNYGRAIKFERLLKPFKGGVFGNAGGKFLMFIGGSENA
jgi:hypothetical protein